MKRIIFSLFLLLFFKSYSFSQSPTAPVLTNSWDVNSTQMSPGMNIAGRAISSHLFTWSVQRGPIISCTLTIQTSPNGVTWTQQGGTYDCSVNGTSNSITFVANYIAVQAITFNNGGVNTPTPYVTVNYAGSINPAYTVTTINNLSPTAQNINGTYYSANFSGATEDIKLTAAINALPTTGGTIYTSVGTTSWATCPFIGVTKNIQIDMMNSNVTLTGSCTASSNISFRFEQGANVAIASNQNLIINGVVDAPPTAIFNGLGLATLTSSSTAYPRVEWWGAKPDNSTDNTGNIQRAIRSSGRLKWGAGVFLTNPDAIGAYLATGVSNIQSVKWEGNFDNNISSSTSGTTTIRANASGTTLFKSSVVLGDFQYLTFDGNDEVTNVAELIPNSSWVTFRHVSFLNPTPTTGTVVWLDGFNGGPTSSEVDSLTFDNVHIAGDPSNHPNIGLHVDGSNTFKFHVTNSELDSAKYLVYIGGATGAGGGDFSHVQFEFWDTDAVYIANGPTQALSFVSCYSETSNEFINGTGIYAAAGYNPILFEQNQFNANIQFTVWAGQPYLFIGNGFNYLVFLEATKTTGGATSYYMWPTAINNTFGPGFDFSSNSGHGSDVNEFNDLLGTNYGVPRTTLNNLKIGDNSSLQDSRITEFITTSQTFNFGSTVTGAVTDITTGFFNVATGDTIIVTPPSGVIQSGASGFYGWVSSAGNVTIRFWNASGSTLDPASGTFRIDAWKH